MRLDFAITLKADPTRAKQVADIFTRPTFAQLEQVRGDAAKKESKRIATSAAEVIELIAAPEYDALSFESSGRELVAAASLPTAERFSRATGGVMTLTLARPVADDTEAFIRDICELAGVLETIAGFVAVEPRFLLAYKLATGQSIPEAREGLSHARRVGRRAYDFHSDQIATKIATVEWGTFLGAGHRGQTDLDQLRSSNAFTRVVEISPSLAFVQITDHPLDDLSGELESRMPAAIEALAPALMDVGDVSLGS